MKALSKKLICDLSTLKVQIFSMAVLIACGVAVLVASWSSYLSLLNAKNLYYDQHRFADIFADFVRAPRSIQNQFQNIPDIEAAEGRIVIDAMVDIPEQPEPALARILSWNPQQVLNKIYLRQGRLPEKGSNLEILVHESFAQANHLKVGNSFFITIKGFKNKVTVSGIGISPEYVYALSPLLSFPDDKHFGIFWMLNDDLERLTDMEGAINNLTFRIQKGSSVKSAIDQITPLISKYGGLGAYDRTQQISHLFVQDEIRQQKSMSTVAPGIFILVASFILYTVLTRLISLQRPQIATLKSIGYSSESLVFYYFKLVTIILIIGIVPALIMAAGIGYWYASLYAQFFRFPRIDFSLSTQSIMIGIIAGTVPSWLAASLALQKVFVLNPAEAMRPATPFKMNTYFLKKGWFKNSRVQQKLIYRNILIKPWQCLFSTLGIAAALAIIINGSFWSDIMNFMIDQQFYKLHREDIEVQFLHPRPQEALSQLKKIEGVYIVNGIRTAAVKLHFKNFSKDTLLTGLDQDLFLRKVATKSGENIKIPPSQVILSQYFAKKYSLHQGDQITLESSDKTSPPFEVTVGGFIDEIMGASIYANKIDLHRWLQEQNCFTGAYLKIATTEAQKIYLNLKQMPEVISINIKKSALESFNTNLSRMILIFTLILVFFATAISSAVLFNMARISLSEKSWELASLKILGYDLMEIFEILHIEMGIQVIIASIPGLMMGYGLSVLSTKWIHTDLFVFPLIIKIGTYSIALAIIISLYFLTGFYLLSKTKNMNMTDALKARE